MTSLQQRVCGAFRTTLFECSASGELLSEETKSIDSIVLSELWFSRIRESKCVMECRGLSELAPTLFKISKDSFPGLLSGQWDVHLDRLVCLKELKAVHEQLHLGRWPSRFFFSPSVAGLGPFPVYSSRKMRTGVMHAGFDLCMINRNWDGTDRIEDLTSREQFDDAVGEIRIIRKRISAHLSNDLLQWIDLLESSQASTFALQFSRFEDEPEGLALLVQERAERWRLRWGVPDYQIHRIGKVQEQWQAILSRKRPHVENVIDLGAYMSEMMRALWGGKYRNIRADDGIPTFGQPKPLKPQVNPAVVLEFPFDCSIQPLEKVHRSLEQKKAVDWSLQMEVLEAQRRQRGLLLRLGRELYDSDPARRLAVLKIFLEILDGRIDRMLLRWLPTCEEPDQIMYVLERLLESRMRLELPLLVSLVGHERIGVAARAFWLLSNQSYKSLPELFVQQLAGGARIPLRPLARHLLTSFGTTKVDKTRAKKVLRSLGPIPPTKHEEQLYPDPPMLLETMPLLAEILEDCANPSKKESAIRILMLFPDRSEEEVLGAALADPESSIRIAAIGLLSGSKQPLVQQLLKTRVLFEQDSLCRILLQQALLKVG